MKQTQNKSTILFVFIALALLFSCNESNDEKDIDRALLNIPKAYDKAEYSRDSSYISYTIKEYIKNNYSDYNYQYLVQDQKKINIYIENIFYSIDNRKLLAFVILEMPVYLEENPTSLEDPNKKYYYNGEILVGIRDSIREGWQIYPANLYSVANYATYKKVSYKLKKFMVKDFKNKFGFGNNCNIQESCFWDDTTSYWRKGNIIPGYYDFQVNTNEYYYKRDKDKYDLKHFLMPEIKIDYPKELLEQYK